MTTSVFDWVVEYEKALDILSDEKLDWEVQYPGTYAFVPGLQGKTPTKKREFTDVFNNEKEELTKPKSLVLEEAYIPQSDYVVHRKVSKCSNCNGTGKIKQTTFYMNVEHFQDAVIEKDEACPYCKGFGKFAEDRLINPLTGRYVL